MDRFIKLKDSDKNAAYRKAAAEGINLPEELIEKDFWVCWTLQELFAINGLKDNLIFKGGTTLSKVYDIIQRFSEDIDLAIEKAFLGFDGDKDPSKATGKRRKKLIEELSTACTNYIKNDLLPLLQENFSKKLTGSWRLELDPTDTNGHTILFFYPKLTEKKSGYIQPAVKIELGSRSEHFPFSQQSVKPYITEILPSQFKDMHALPKVLEIERTFWEKATILHYYANADETKKINERQSRHYYDFYKILTSEYRASCLEKVEILEMVASHKILYFTAAWAKYNEAKKGTLKLIPIKEVQEIMERDYKRMAEMFITDAPTWNDVIKEISNFEKEFNSAK